MPGLRAERFLLRLAIKDDNLLSVVDDTSATGTVSEVSLSDLGDDSSTASSVMGFDGSTFSSFGSSTGAGCFFLGSRLLTCEEESISRDLD